MELLLNATSPYARLSRICAIERGLADRLRLRWVDPWSDDPALLAVNPAGRVPALRTDDGRCLAEALAIALYFDAQGSGPRLFPSDGGAALARTGPAIGLIDAAFGTVIARKHHGPEADRSVLGARRHRAIQRSLDWLADDLPNGDPEGAGDLDMGSIAAAVALDYLAFRLPEYRAAERKPGLERWRAGIADRPSFRDTAFA